ncbi:hypothetical protein M5K25_019601 [Dendrobium thyrsiflorum]|uniref:TF-B3 domain-containing protein n=1 Tax=Dendrobium thyrsiflorum TaxID=117978 RepID=A0ABD0UMI2_DENTH
MIPLVLKSITGNCASRALTLEKLLCADTALSECTISPGIQWAIPARFVSDHFNVKPKKIILCKQEQKEWIVSCRFINSSFGFAGKSWLHFVQDNELKEGDVLFFKLINGSKGVMDVRIV